MKRKYAKKIFVTGLVHAIFQSLSHLNLMPRNTDGSFKPNKGGPTTDVRELVTIALCEDIKKFKDGRRDFTHEITPEYAKHMTNHKLVGKK